MSATHFRELHVWQDAMRLAKDVYRMTGVFPRDERFGLCSQMQRAAVSIPSNMAEGNVRQSRRDYARFVGIASGSAAELQTQLLLAHSLEIADPTAVAERLDLCEQVSKMIYRPHQSLMRDAADRSPVPRPQSRN